MGLHGRGDKSTRTTTENNERCTHGTERSERLRRVFVQACKQMREGTSHLPGAIATKGAPGTGGSRRNMRRCLLMSNCGIVFT